MSTTGLTFQSKSNAILVSRRLAMVELSNDHNDCVRKEEALAQRRWDARCAEVIHGLRSQKQTLPPCHLQQISSPNFWLLLEKLFYYLPNPFVLEHSSLFFF